MTEEITGRDAGRVSSSASTGGAGTFFEQHVDAYWLAQLLVRGIPPILIDCAVVEVHLQTERLGWHTDDFLIVGQNGRGDSRKLAGQVKRTFTVSANDDACRKAVQDFWKDFKNPRLFSPDVDRFALVTLRGTNTLLEHFSGLLQCSRAARDGAQFESRLATPGFLSKKSVEYCNEVCRIIGDSEGKSVSAADVWQFLRVLHVLSLDLNSSTRQTEAVIKTLLAHTTSEQDTLNAAEASWNALLCLVGEGMPEARSFRHVDLPEEVRRRHPPVGGAEQRALRDLSDHSAIILDGIRSTIGSELHLSRSRLVQQIIGKMESTQVVLVSGTAGSGKSAIAKDAISILATDHFAFSFRAEEFSSPHFDETLQRNQISARAAMLGAMLAGQGLKVMLVESIERLLEASTRDAFTDLLTIVARDRSWRIILTCRDYSADLVRACFLKSAGLGHSVVTVPPLDDRELQDVEEAFPTLALPLANAPLRRLLQNPYILDMALQIPWSEERSLPQSEREFRALVWREIIRVEHHAAGGMPRRREEAFVQIALRRARALTLYARCGDLDPEVVNALRRDSLIISSSHSGILVAPAHDVLEDWAILQWMDEQYATHEGSVRELSAVIGAHPAVRRTYRKWVDELVKRDPETADRVFKAVVYEGELPAQFRDDTLVSLLRSSTSAAFLERHSAKLFTNDKQLLRRVIHLLRVGCVTTPTWLETLAAQASLFSVPDGPAWACVLRLVQRNLGSFTDSDNALLLALIDEWARGVSWQTPYPEGARSVVAIAHWLLPGFDDYRSDDQRRRTLQVIAKIPNSNPERFAALLRRTLDRKDRDRAADDFQEMVLEGLEGWPAGRDMPDIVVSAANDYLSCSDADVQDEWRYAGSLELEPLFGIKAGRSLGYFPPSAYRGPFLPLLRHHPDQGVAFIIAVFNHSADWYAHPRVRSQYVEPPFEMTLTFADGTSRTQWCNDRLWNLYRGMSVGPDVLQSLLMSLERWLMEFAEARPAELDAVLLHILQQSDCAALTAVVASAATAFPHASGEALLVLLRSPLCIKLDRHRLASESQAISGLSGVLPRLNPESKIYDEERKDADAYPHRRHDLEAAIVSLQSGPLASRVHEILDAHRAKMPPVEEQDEGHRIWRLALNRMDLRQYEVAKSAPEAPVGPNGQASPGDGCQYIYLNLRELEPDVKEMVDRSAVKFHDMNARMGLLMWGIKVFGQEEVAKYDPAQWRQRLQEARTTRDRYRGPNKDVPRGGGPGFVAAVCVRDHWEEISSDEREWCVDVICSEVERDADNWNPIARVQRARMEPNRPAAWALPLLLGRPLDDDSRLRVHMGLALALTHAIKEVRWYAAQGVGSNLWKIDRELTLRCVNALSTEATLVQRGADAENSRPYQKRRQFADIEAQAAALVRQRFPRAEAIADDAYQEMDATTWLGAEANARILSILAQAPTEAVAIAAFERLAHTLVGWWNADVSRPRNRGQRSPKRNYEIESVLTHLLENFLLRASTGAEAIVQPILDAVDRHPREVHWLLLGLISVEDREPNTQRFWSLWNLFADKVRRAAWLEGIDREHASGVEIVSAMFLGTSWKQEVRHWRSLEGHTQHVYALFQDLPASSTVLDAYVRFLYHVGEQSLPDAFIRIAERLRQGDPRQMIRKGNTIFLLEALLQRYVYGKPLELKSHDNLREAVLFLLDLLIENGSSAAFRMRDDFVTPASTT